MACKVGLVVGVTGIVGLNLSKRLLQEGWKVYGTSRKNPDYLPKDINHLAVDLTDVVACQKVMGPVKDITHVFFTSWISKPTEEEMCVVS